MQPELPGSLTADDYARAEALLVSNLSRTSVFNHGVSPSKIPGTDRFWYRVSTRQGPRFMEVDPGAGIRREAFDHESVAKALAGLMDQPVSADALPLVRIDFKDPGRVGLHVPGARFVLNLETGDVVADPHGGIPLDQAPSPDGRWAAVARDHDLYLRNLETGEERRISHDGTPDRAYAVHPDGMAWSHELESIGFRMPPPVAWSADGRKLMTVIMDQTGMERQWYVTSSPRDESLPTARSKAYPMPGHERLPLASYILVDLESGELLETEIKNVPSPYMSTVATGHTWFSRDAATAYVVTTDRYCRKARLQAVDASTGRARSLCEEESATQVDLHPDFTGCNLRTEGNTLLWWSERDGWGHLYRYALDTGEFQNVVTQGDWLVNNVLAMDEEAGFVWFAGSGREPGDPYGQRLYRARLDGGGVELLDGEEAHHALEVTDQGGYFVDTFSSMEDLGRSVVRNRDGEVVMELETGDGTDLETLGFRAPERLALTAADGETEIWANVFLPAEMESGVLYPVLDDVYPGPQVNRCPVSLAAGLGGTRIGASLGFRDAAALASLGFIVVQIDGRGTPFRSKAFHDHSYGAIQCGSDIEDHEAALGQLATRYPLDLGRVGIFGLSGGGFASTRALLVKPDLYKVAVSICGNHDQRIYWSMWGEKYHGPPQESDYLEQSNTTHAGSLRGKLLLIHGELDDNVSPSHTLRVVDKLIEQDADFEMILVPNAGHMFLGKTAFITRRLWDFFVRHLLGAEPPKGYHLQEPPMDLSRLMG